jgi:MoaA/NifB/PqqE/SkfB family radical SAM enzyme
LRLLLSGGEPLLHADFWRMNEILRDYDFRSVMLSNGVLITRGVAKRLRVHEVQISLDGMEAGHELIRGEGTFEKALQAIDHLREFHIRVSIATMIHRGNVKEFEAMDTLIRSRDIEEWNIDQPCLEGRLKENQPVVFSGMDLEEGFITLERIRPAERTCVPFFRTEGSPSVGSLAGNPSVRLMRDSAFAGRGFQEFY